MYADETRIQRSYIFALRKFLAKSFSLYGAGDKTTWGIGEASTRLSVQWSGDDGNASEGYAYGDSLIVCLRLTLGHLCGCALVSLVAVMMMMMAC